jgi:transcription antitermination factor NusG
MGYRKEITYGLCRLLFAGLEAVVTQILPVRERVKILMDFLGRKVEAEVDCASLLWQAA